MVNMEVRFFSSQLEKLIEYSLKKGYKINDSGEVFNVRDKKLSLTPQSNGYLKFTIRFNKKVKTIPIHQFQAYKKFGNLIFKKGIQVRHLNGNKLDNSWDNIEIGNQSDNQLDIPEKDRIIRSGNNSRTYDHKSIIEDRNIGMSYLEIMNKYNIQSKGTISFIINKSLESFNFIN